MTVFHRLTRKISSGIAAAVVVTLAVGAAHAQLNASDLLPAAGEQRLTLTIGGRSVAFPAKITPIAQVTVPFESAGHAVTEEGRQALVRLQEALFRQPGGSLILVVYGENEALAFQRARAVRGELAERHSMDPARIIATGRKAEGHAGDLAVVDVFTADATRCGGCGTSTFRTVALDSGAASLVTSTAETLPGVVQQPRTAAEPRALTPEQAIPRPPKVQTAAPKAAAQPAMPRQQAAVRPAQQPAAGCVRPRIIIDDYYPGGPMVPCGLRR
jgi:hypothetical protein